MFEEIPKGHALQGVNKHRGSVGSYTDIPDDHYNFERDPVVVACAVMEAILQTFGRAGLRAFKEINPTLFMDLEESVKEAYREGHYTGWLAQGLERADESHKRTVAMVTAAFDSALKNEDQSHTTVRMLAAHAGVDPEHIPFLKETP